MTPDAIESTGKIVLAIVLAFAPLIKLYLEMIKARFEADMLGEKVRHYETGVSGLKRKKNYLPWRTWYASTATSSKADLGTLRSEDPGADNSSGARGGGEEQR